jgi:hypothetical protein
MLGADEVLRRRGPQLRLVKVFKSVCSISFGELHTFLFGVFLGMCGENSCNVFLRLFMALWVPTSATLCRRAILMLWHAFMFLGLRFFPLFFSLFGGLRCFFL